MAFYDKLKIFAVDDDPFYSAIIKKELEKEKLNEVTLFKNGEDCIAKLHLKPNIVVLDMDLSGNDPNAADGLEILKSIRKYSEDIHVIMLSGKEHYGKALQTIAGGAEQYILKKEDAMDKLSKMIEEIRG